MVPKVADVSGFLGSLNVFVMPSRREGFGMTMLEALAAGLPVVASDLPVLREVGGEVVRWAAPGDPASLAQALRTIPEDAWSDDAVAARRERAEIFSVDRMVEAYLALYAEILDRRARRAG
jgi:glycosyltransferase involved in cell wall biosynthesis